MLLLTIRIHDFFVDDKIPELELNNKINAICDMKHNMKCISLSCKISLS